MIKNYFKVAIRNIASKRLYSLINILGLSLGLSGAMMIWQYVSFERSYDQFHEKGDRIFRLPTHFDTGGRQDGNDAMNAAPVGPALLEELPEVEAYVRVSPMYNRLVLKYGVEKFEEQKVFFADSNYFEFFDYKILYGDPSSALVDPFSLVLTKTLAENYFGPEETWKESPVGKTLRANNMINVTVTAIAEDMPENTHFKFNALISFSTFSLVSGDPSNAWEWNDFYTYILVKEPVDLTVLDRKLHAFADRHLNTSDSRKEYKVYYSLQPVKDIHLHSHLGYEAEPNGDDRTVSFLLLVAIAILLIAWANYINLSTARAEERAQEVGVRKVIGADRKSLVAQFLTEAFLVNAFAIVIALFLIYCAQPFMNHLTGKELVSIFEVKKLLALTAVGVLLFGTLLSGIYPAIVLSSFKPGRTLQSATKGRRQGWFRRILVTFQYASSIVLIVATLIIFRQLNFMQDTDLGFNMDQKIVVNTPSVYADSVERQLYHAFRNTLRQSPNIDDVTASSAIPGKYYYDLDSWGGLRLEGADESMAASFMCFRIDEAFFSTYGLEIIAGKDYSNQTSADDIAAAVNEAALPLLGLASPEEAIGKRVMMQGDRVLPIINVFRNYHHKSLRHQYEPMILWTFPPDPDPLYYTIKFNGNSTSEVTEVIAKIDQVWQEIFPDNPFSYFFFDDQFNEQYAADTRLGKIVAIFSLFAVFIACLGLLGLTSYMISVRTKEIGIRKILGASIRQIVGLLTVDFLKLVFLALVFAVPIGLYVGNSWLNNFPFRSTVQWWIFILAGGLAVGIAGLTVSIQSIRAALANPIDALKAE